MSKISAALLIVGLLIGAGVMAFANRRTRINGLDFDSTTRAMAETDLNSHLFWTWDTLELDKCAAAWLIRRLVDPEAVIQFYPKHTVDKPGTPFDIPGAAWSRQPGKCGTEAILESLDIDDPALRKIAGFARVAELARWQLDDHPEAREHHVNVRVMIDAHPDPYVAFEHVAVYLDELYERLSSSTADTEEHVAARERQLHALAADRS